MDHVLDIGLFVVPGVNLLVLDSNFTRHSLDQHMLTAAQMIDTKQSISTILALIWVSRVSIL